VLFVRSVAGLRVAIDASAPSIAALFAAFARLSSSQEYVLAETFSDRIMLNIGVSVGVISEMLVVRLVSLILDRLSTAICYAI